jgi:hypothetical protein
MSLPKDWLWMAWGGDGRVRHIDLARVLTGGSKMKQVHLSEYLAALDIPAKISAPPFAVARLIETEAYDLLQGVVEGDVISTALLLARWRRMLDPRADIDVVEDRILRQVEELRAGRGYIPALQAHRAANLRKRLEAAANDAKVLAPWLDAEAA